MRLNRIEEVDAGTEQQRNAYPHTCHLQCLTHTHLVLAFLGKHLQVGYEHHKYQNIKNNPSP